MCAIKAKIFNTEKTEIKKLKRNSQSLPFLFALISPVNLLGCARRVAARPRCVMPECFGDLHGILQLLKTVLPLDSYYL